MATTIWSNKQIDHWSSSGYIKMDGSYDYYRIGADMNYIRSVTVKQTGSKSIKLTKPVNTKPNGNIDLGYN